MLGIAVRYQKVISFLCNNFAAKVSNIHLQRSPPQARQLPKFVPVDAGFLCNKPAMLRGQ
jgi:hypothetical protein